MAKEKVAVKKAKKKTVAKKAKEDNGAAFGVADVAKSLGVTPTTARNLMRNAGIKKSGKAYGFATKKEVEDCVRKIEKASA